MAETIVCFVIDKLLPLLTTKADLIGSLQDDLAAIDNELRSIKVLLKDAESRAEDDHGVKEWVRQVRCIAYQIEDVVDEHVMLQHPHQGHGLRNILERLSRGVMQLRSNHRIANTIKNIRSEILDVHRRKSIYNLDQGPSSSNSLPHDQPQNGVGQNNPKASFDVQESELVGIEDPKRDLFRLLDIDCQTLTKNEVISIVGMGGLGKTTLVRKVYEDILVTKHFPLRAWLTLSRSESNRMNAIRSIIKQFYKCVGDSIYPDIDTLDEQSLVDDLRYYLQLRRKNLRFLIVFDDVWSIETYLKDVLPSNDNGSKILMTTRLDDVALAWKGSMYKLQHLTPERAWELFCKITFQRSKAICPPTLAKFSNDIVKKCEGLPLAIITIGRLLSNKNQVVTEWKHFCDSIGVALVNNRHLSNIKKILLHSYHDLPHYLKPCFLYIGLFPEGSSVSRKRLIKLWIAEGFVSCATGKTLEEVSQEYLIELVYRNLVQVTWVDICGRPRGFRVHDLLREIILLKSEDLSFCQVLDNENLQINRQCRRLVFQNNKLTSHNKEILEKNIKNSSVRSLFLFEQHCDALCKFMTGSFLKNVRFLRVLDLPNATVDHIPKAIGSLFYLHYLSLRGTKVEKLPSSIGKLHYLQTLDLKHSLVEELPTEISKLRNLRHLTAYSYHWDGVFSSHIRDVIAAKIPSEICRNSLDIQNLGWVDSQSVGLLDHLGNLKHLQRLGIAGLVRQNGNALCNAIKNMHRLQSILIASEYRSEVLDLDHMSSPPMLLRRVHLVGRLERLPRWISQLENVVRISLCHSSLKDDPLEIFGALPNLKKLVFSEAYAGSMLHFRATHFQKLKILRLFDLHYLKSVAMESGTLPVLEELEIGSSPYLDVPTGIQHLKSLKLLSLHDMPAYFSNAITPKTGKQCQLIKHVPNVYNSIMAGAGHWESSSLRRPLERHTLVYSRSSSMDPIRSASRRKGSCLPWEFTAI